MLAGLEVAQSGRGHSVRLAGIQRACRLGGGTCPHSVNLAHGILRWMAWLIYWKGVLYHSVNLAHGILRWMAWLIG